MLDNNSASGRWLHRGGFSLLRNFFYGQENEVFYLVMFQIVALMSALRRARSCSPCVYSEPLSFPVAHFLAGEVIRLLPKVLGNASELKYCIIKFLIGGILVIAYRFR